MIIYKLGGQVVSVDCSRENREYKQMDETVHAPNMECTFDVERFFRGTDNL